MPLQISPGKDDFLELSIKRKSTAIAMLQILSIASLPGELGGAGFTCW